MAIVKDTSATAYSAAGGGNPSFLRIAINKAAIEAQAQRRRQERELGFSKEQLSLSGQIFDKKMAMQTKMAEGRLGFQRYGFDRNYDMQRKIFEAGRPSDLEYFLSSAMPMATAIGAGIWDKRNQQKFQQQMTDLDAQARANMQTDLQQISQSYGQETYNMSPSLTGVSAPIQNQIRDKVVRSNADIFNRNLWNYMRSNPFQIGQTSRFGGGRWR